MKPMRLLRNSARLPSDSLPVSTASIRTCPEVGRISSPRQSRVVVLPLPDRPTIETNSPFSMSRVMPSMAWTAFAPLP
jgi:hypothetical protein